jgi:hypothetical protein
MSNTIKVGNWLYGRADMPLYGKVLRAIGKANNGAPLAIIYNAPAILKDFNGDAQRSQAKCGAILANLRMRRVVAEFRASEGSVVYKITNKAEALELIKNASEIESKIADLTSKSESITIQSAGTVKPATEKKKMSDKKNVKVARLYLNQDSKTVEPFGVGRPSKEKLAFECDSKGVLVRPADAAAFIQNGLKSDDKLTKAELLKIVQDLRAEVSNLSGFIADLTGENDEDESEDTDEGSQDCDGDAEVAEVSADSDAVEADEVA